jgi:predicted nucleic acid-binding OB-fold protein
MYYSTFTARHIFMLISREEICCLASSKAQKTKCILLILDWLPVMQKENASLTQRKSTMVPLNTQAEMLMMEVTASSSITLIQRVKIGGYNSGRSFTVNAYIPK